MEDCVQCKTWSKKQYWNEFPDNKKHFFKIMLGDFRNYLRIPRKFKAEFKGKLSKMVVLRGPSGNSWTAKVAKKGEDFVLQNGWRDFVKDHSLKERDFLVFRFVENTLFDVLIFDATGCEREDSHFVEQNGENCRCKRKNTNQQTMCHQRKRMDKKAIMQEDDEFVEMKMREEDEDEDEDEMKTQEEEDEDSQQEIQGTSTKMGRSKFYKSKRRPITKKEKDRAFHLASKHLPTRPCCKIRMKPTHVHHLFILTIPRDFADSCLPKKSQEIRLRVDSNYIWIVSFQRKQAQCTLNKGWARFVLENNLEIDDYCVLELADIGTSRKPPTLDVHIFRVVKKLVPLKVVIP